MSEGFFKDLSSNSDLEFMTARVYSVSEFHYVAKAGLKLTIFLPQPAECWDYRHVPPHLPFMH
jgi:hypothetical protein